MVSDGIMTVDRSEHLRELRAFLRTIECPEQPLGDVDEDTSLVAAGFIDSLAVLAIVGACAYSRMSARLS
jgi:hypothetical protein